MPEETSPAPLTAVVFHILLAMADGHEHGYAIGKAAEETSGLRMGPGTIYGSLQRMERDGLVKELEGGDDRRKPFALTDAGRRALVTEADRIIRLAELARSRDLVTGSDGAR
jgi:DNA-binding PadR family transcriptional regulator